MSGAEKNLDALNAWAKSLPVAAFIKVFYYGDPHPGTKKWAVRFCTPGNGGLAHPLRTRHGDVLEEVCAELLPLAQKIWEEQKNSLIAKHQRYQKRESREIRNVTREIEAMHHTADDF